MNASNSDSETRVHCGHCNRKLGLIHFTCKCKGTYCKTCIFYLTHQCTFDYKQEGRDRLSAQNKIVVSEKIQKI